MAHTLDIGRRVELLPMDPHFHDISLAIYLQAVDSGSGYLVHSYSGLDGAPGRVADVKKAMQVMGGMGETGDGLLYFPCGQEHRQAIKRCFLEACKLDSTTTPEPKPLSTLDKKSGLTMVVESFGDGRYRVSAEGEGKDRARRIGVVAGGIRRLAEMDSVGDELNQGIFSCGQPHDALVGLLLVRAPNVRAALREYEDAASRGVLAAPSQQER